MRTQKTPDSRCTAINSKQRRCDRKANHLIDGYPVCSSHFMPNQEKINIEATLKTLKIQAAALEENIKKAYQDHQDQDHKYWYLMAYQAQQIGDIRKELKILEEVLEKING